MFGVELSQSQQSEKEAHTEFQKTRYSVKHFQDIMQLMNVSFEIFLN